MRRPTPKSDPYPVLQNALNCDAELIDFAELTILNLLINNVAES